MDTSGIDFYLRHRGQITEWARIADRVDGLMQDAVSRGDHAAALALLRAQSGDAEADFYVRNRALITEWDSLQTASGLALHEQLMEAARTAGHSPWEGKRKWTTVTAISPELDEVRAEYGISFELAWTKGDLLSTHRGVPYPRLAFVTNPNFEAEYDRPRVRKATRSVAHSMGMKSTDNWFAHWCVLPALPDGQGLDVYAEECVARLQEAADRLFPVVLAELPT